MGGGPSRPGRPATPCCSGGEVVGTEVAAIAVAVEGLRESVEDVVADAYPFEELAVAPDADACPAVVKDILFRAADRAKVAVTLVANQWLRTPPSPWIRSLQVAGGFDVADTAIVERVAPGDLVVTQDIPLAARVLEKGGIAVNPRGDLYTPDNMAERLSMRDFMEELRGVGVQTGGPAAFHARDRQAFANQLDRWLAQRGRG